MDNRIRHTIKRFVHYKKLGGVADTPDICATIQEDFNTVEKKISDSNIMKFNKGNAKIDMWGGINPRHCLYWVWGPAGRQLLRGYRWGPGGQQAEQEPAMYLCKVGQQYPGLY